MGRPAKKPRGVFGAHLVALREAAGLTQHQLADRIKVHQTNIAFWERSDKAPRGEVLPDLATQLGVTVDELFGAVPAKPKPQLAAKGRLQKVFEAASKLPRRQQVKVAEFLEAFVEHQKSHS